MGKGRIDTITDWGDGEGKASDRKDRKKQELRKAQKPPGSGSSPVARCSDGPRPKGRSSEAGLGQREGAGQGGSSRSQVAGPGKSVSKRSVEKDLKAESW